jgi:hypothetical protein
MAYYNTGDITAASGVLQHARQGIDHQQLHSRSGGMDGGTSGSTSGGGSSSRLHSYSGMHHHHHQSQPGAVTSPLAPPESPSLIYGRPCTSNSSFHGYAPSANGRGLSDSGFDHLDPANGDVYLPLHHAFSQLQGCGGLSGITSPSTHPLTSPGAAVSAPGFRDYLSPTVSAANTDTYTAAASSSSGLADYCNGVPSSLQCSPTPVYPWMTVVGEFYAELTINSPLCNTRLPCHYCSVYVLFTEH